MNFVFSFVEQILIFMFDCQFFCNVVFSSASPGSQSSVQFSAGSLDTFGSNLLEPLDSAQRNAATGGEPEPPDTGQAAEDG